MDFAAATTTACCQIGFYRRRIAAGAAARCSGKQCGASGIGIRLIVRPGVSQVWASKAMRPKRGTFFPAL